MLESITSFDIRQPSNRKSLRDLVIALDTHQGKAYHLGLGKNVIYPKLIKIETTVFLHLLLIIWLTRYKRNVKSRSLISAVMFMPLILQPLTCAWLHFGGQSPIRKRGGIKIHTLYDVETYIPAFFHIATAL